MQALEMTMIVFLPKRTVKLKPMTVLKKLTPPTREVIVFGLKEESAFAKIVFE
jgi:hypothetical protein